MAHGSAHRKTIIWLGSEPDEEQSDYGYDIFREDAMLSIETSLENEEGEELQVFIQPALFPAMRRVMDLIEGRSAPASKRRLHGRLD